MGTCLLRKERPFAYCSASSPVRIRHPIDLDYLLHFDTTALTFPHPSSPTSPTARQSWTSMPVLATPAEPSHTANAGPGIDWPVASTSTWWLAFLPADFDTVRSAHAVLAACAFLILFPLGGIMMHVSSHPNMVRVHACVQGLAYVVFAVAAGLGICMARKVHAVRIPIT